MSYVIPDYYLEFVIFAILTSIICVTVIYSHLHIAGVWSEGEGRVKTFEELRKEWGKVALKFCTTFILSPQQLTYNLIPFSSSIFSFSTNPYNNVKTNKYQERFWSF